MWSILSFPDYPVICPSNNQLTAYQTEYSSWEARLPVPEWCDGNTSGCRLRCGVVVAGSSKTACDQKVELLDIATKEKKELPNLIYPSARVGIIWDPTNNSLILAGGDQRKNGRWNMTAEMFKLNNVGERNSKWEQLQCELPSPMIDPELLMSDSHLYLLGCDENRMGARRIPRNKKPDPIRRDMNVHSIPLAQPFKVNDWEKLEDLQSQINGEFGQGGAVFIHGKVIVFTLHHIMTLNTETKPPSWNTVKNEKDLENCIPRPLNCNTILVLVNHQNNEGASENFIEMYDPQKNTWEPWKPSVQNVNVNEASLVPWKFFIVHTVAVTGELCFDVKYVHYPDHLT